MKTPLIEQLNLPHLLDEVSHLQCHGRLAMTSNHFVYLDIDDAFIHRLFPFIKTPQIIKPDYFGEELVGAHITVFYPEENVKLNKKELGQEHHFTVQNIVAAGLGLKTYYVLLVESPTLLQLRKQYKVPDLLCFKGYSIGFHITIGVQRYV